MAQAQHVTIDGTRLETAWFAPACADRPTIVMLHDALGSVASWRSFPSLLAERTRCGVVAYSRAGHGHSAAAPRPRPLDYLQHQAESVLPSVLQQLGITRPVLFGHSDGATIAIIFAGTFPAHAAGIVLEAPHVFVEERTLRGIAAARDEFAESGIYSRLARYHDDPYGVFKAWTDVWLDPAFRAWNIEEYLSSIRCPALVLQGEDDEYGTQAQLDAIGRRARDCETIVLRNCGHVPHRERIDDTLDATVRFMQRIAYAPLDTRGTIKNVIV